MDTYLAFMVLNSISIRLTYQVEELLIVGVFLQFFSSEFYRFHIVPLLVKLTGSLTREKYTGYNCKRNKSVNIRFHKQQFALMTFKRRSLPMIYFLIGNSLTDGRGE